MNRGADQGVRIGMTFKVFRNMILSMVFSDIEMHGQTDCEACELADAL